MNRVTITRSAAVLAAVSLAVAACGGSSTGGESTAAPAVSSATAQSPSAAASPAASATACTNPTLVLGSLMPQTGDLAFLGPPMTSGVEFAVQQMNDAGGVLGAPVELIPADEGDTKTDIASQSADSLLQQNVQAVVGAASTAVTLTVIDKLTSNGVLMVSPSNTGPILTTYDDGGLYFRTAPSDALQGAVVASRAIDDGITAAAVIARQDPYGEGLEKAFSSNFTDAGGTVTSELLYDPAASSFDAEVTEIKAGGPEAVVVIGFDETAKIVQELIKQGLGPQDVPLYLVDGNTSATAYEAFDAGVMKGTTGTIPTSDVDVTAFNDSLKAFNPDLTDFTYSAQAFDAATLIGLAAEAAGCADGPAMAAAMVAVAGDGGEPCSTFAECVPLLQAGKDIDFTGVTGPLDFNEVGDPKSGTISINEYSTNTEYAMVDKVTAEVPLP